MPIIALMSDFGTRDHYVACMKGVILQLDAKAQIVDVTHEIAPQDVLAGAFTLRQVLPWFPTKTIFVCVIDPGVGTNRRILAARYSDRIVLAPDNGLLTLVHRDADLQEIRIVQNRTLFGATLSSTFHGRDIFAPLAARLSGGTSLDLVGPVADRVEMLDLGHPRPGPGGALEGQILLADRFGNLVTNISNVDLVNARAAARNLQVTFHERLIGPLRSTYAEVAPGEPLALVGSTLMLEIAVNQGSAEALFNARRGDAVRLA